MPTTTAPFFVGLDLGGTNLRLRLHDPDDHMRREHREPHQQKSLDALNQSILQILQQWRDELNIEAPFYLSASVAAMLDPTGNIVRNAPNLGWREIPLAHHWNQLAPWIEHVTLYNDLKAATYGEFRYGGGRGTQHLLCVFVGSGVGSGFVLNGELHQGAKRIAGELGHIKVELEDGAPCGCGGFGCLEAYVGGHHLAKQAQQAATIGYLAQQAQQLGREQLSARQLEEGAQQNDPTCVALLRRAARYLGACISHATTLLDPERLLLGGGVLLHCPTLLEQTKQALHQFGNPTTLERLDIQLAELGDNAGLLGAIALARQELIP